MARFADRSAENGGAGGCPWWPVCFRFSRRTVREAGGYRPAAVVEEESRGDAAPDCGFRSAQSCGHHHAWIAYQPVGGASGGVVGYGVRDQKNPSHLGEGLPDEILQL